MAWRVDAATGVGEAGELDHLAMAPVVPDSRLQAQVVALQLKVAGLETILENNYETLKNFQDTRTRALNQSLTMVRQTSDAKDLAHEEALRKQANQTKALEVRLAKLESQANQSRALEVRLAKLESAQPPPYAVTALSKSSKKK